MEKLPRKAGMATLTYAPCAEPTRHADVITIPATFVRCECGEKTPEGNFEYCPKCGCRLERSALECKVRGELLPLMKDYEQFVFLQPGRLDPRWNEVWFGGTDERPFLVQMDVACLTAVRLGDFHSYIVPGHMITLCRKWGGTWKRQGDIFAYPLPFSWEDLEQFGNFAKAKGLQIHEVENDPVFGTRHSLAGIWCNMLVAGPSSVVAAGTITAPDHADLVLESPHVLAQTDHLHDPSRAD